MNKYDVILADPPWTFKTYSNKSNPRRPEAHYECMSTEDLKNLDVQSISNKDCALFMWCTSSLIPVALQVMEAWGFTFKCVAFVWAKKCKKKDDWFTGLGLWTRNNVEFCILGTKGHPHRVSKNVRQLIVSPIRQHSRKPDEIRDAIVSLCGEVPRIELFARQSTEGWDTWGNETTKFD